MNDKLFHEALRSKDAAAIHRYIDDGCDPCWKDSEGLSLLHIAAAIGDESLVRRLMGRGAKPGDITLEGLNPYDMAVIWGNNDIAKILYDGVAEETLAPKCLADMRVQKDGLYHALRDGYADLVLGFVKAGEGALTADDFLQARSDGDTPLLVLVRRKEVDKIFDPVLWTRQPRDMLRLWDALPDMARAGIDIDGARTGLQALLPKKITPKPPRPFKKPF